MNMGLVRCANAKNAGMGHEMDNKNYHDPLTEPLSHFETQTLFLGLHHHLRLGFPSYAAVGELLIPTETLPPVLPGLVLSDAPQELRSLDPHIFILMEETERQIK